MSMTSGKAGIGRDSDQQDGDAMAIDDRGAGMTAADDKAKIVRDALKVYDDWMERERANIEAGYDDLEFRAGNQWPEEIEAARIEEGRPVQTINQIPQYVRQVTGDMRQMRPAIKVIPVDDHGDEEKAEALAGVIRYIENRSDAPGVYFQGADSQVTCGIGAWRVKTEYAGESTFNQEIRIAPIEDALGVMFDIDAVLPTREDAVKCLVPFDMSREKFKALYPDATVTDFAPSGAAGATRGDWIAADTIRVGEYWCKTPVRKTLALLDDGAIEDVSGDKARAEALKASGIRVEKRESYRLHRSLVTAHEVVEGPELWPGSHIPIVPVIGEEVGIGRRIMRHGVVRFAKDPQRSYNYLSSAQTEVTALQPKAPFIGTEKNFEQYQDVWETANRRNHAYLPYTPDGANGSIPPQRVQPAVSSQGIAEGIERAARDMQSVIGIYNSSLGQRSNETSGRAILARQREGDTGTYVYIDNWARAIRHTGKILVDLIPKIYDTARVLRIIGEDGRTQEIRINQLGGVAADGMTPRLSNDVTTGAYDVALQMGPSYATKREEVRDGMTAFIQAAPQTAPLILDLVAKAQDWHLADEIGERLETVLPPEIRALKAQKAGRPLPQAMQPPPPDPAQQAARQMELATREAELVAKQAEARRKQAEAGKAELALEAAQVAQMLGRGAGEQVAEPQADPALAGMAQAIVELQGVVGEIVQALQGAPPGEVSASTPMGSGEPIGLEPELMAGLMPINQPPPAGAAPLMAEPQGQLPQF